jgi:hypothetical protein
MQRTSPIFPILMMLCCGIALFGPVRASGHAGPKDVPRLYIEEDCMKKVTVVEGFQIRHTFLLQNHGNAPLVISKAEPSCSCIKVHHDPVIQPGKNLYFRVRFDTRGQIGDQVKTIRLVTNDPARPEHTLAIPAEILPAVKATPERVFFNGPAGTPMTAQVKVFPPDRRPFTLEMGENHLPSHIQAVIRERSPETGAYTVVFTSTGHQAGASRGRLCLTTNIPYSQELVIPVYSRLTAPMSLFPEKIDFGKQRLSDYEKTGAPGPVKSLNLRSLNGIPPKVAALDLNQNRFKTDITFLPKLGVTRILVTARMDKFSLGDFKEMMKLSLDDGQAFEVPVFLTTF